MAEVEVYESGNTVLGNSRYDEMNSAYNSTNDDRNVLLRNAVSDRGPRSPDVIRPCYYILPILGMWKPKQGNFEFVWLVYRGLVFLWWLVCLIAIMCLDLVHHGFLIKKINVREVMNSACTCLDFLCPFVFTLYYLQHGQFVELVSSVQSVSNVWYRKLRRIAWWYTVMSVLLWGLCAAFFMVHWFPFFSKSWEYVVYIPVVVYISGWWGMWLTIYGFVCHVHSLQVDTVIEEMTSRQRKPTFILRRHFQLQISLERTQKDFNVMISLALVYHTLDLIVFSFAYFTSAFGRGYPLWQYVGTVLFDLLSLIFKLYPPAMVAAASRRIVVQASKRCQLQVTPLTTDLPLEDMQLFQFMVSCEPEMGLKILGIRITVELSIKILMTIVTAAVSFVAFVIPRL